MSKIKVEGLVWTFPTGGEVTWAEVPQDPYLRRVYRATQVYIACRGVEALEAPMIASPKSDALAIARAGWQETRKLKATRDNVRVLASEIYDLDGNHQINGYFREGGTDTPMLTLRGSGLSVGRTERSLKEISQNTLGYCLMTPEMLQEVWDAMAFKNLQGLPVASTNLPPYDKELLFQLLPVVNAELPTMW